MDIESIIRSKKFGTINQAYYWFANHHPNVEPAAIKKAFTAAHSNKYVKKYNKVLMGNKFSAIRDIYQMDIYFTEEYKTPYLLAVNVNTKYAWASKLKSKNADDVLAVFPKFVEECHPVGIECDAEKAFSSYRFVDYCQQHHIQLKVVLNSLHSELSIINRLCRTLRSMTSDSRSDPDITSYVKKYNKRYHEKIKMAPRDMQFNTNNELRYIYDQLAIRDEKNKLLLRDENKIEKHDKVRYILDEKQHRFSKNQHKHKLSKYYYLVEYIHSPYLYDIVARDGSVKTVPRYRLLKLPSSKGFEYAPSIEDESNYMIYDEIMDYHPVLRKDGSVNPQKSKYVVRVISRDKTGRKLKKQLLLGIMEVRVDRPTDMSKLEREFYQKHKDKYAIEDVTSYLKPRET